MGKRQMVFDGHRSDIERYCIENDLSVDKVFSSSYGQNYEQAFVVHVDLSKGLSPGWQMVDDTPAPVTLAIYLQDDGTLRFEQTEITRKYLGNETRAEEAAMTA